ncbi:Retrovirus-related Pol polyprotein from transposon TNT 1-94 [Senna tora]|uniref:Retrovirus-related Pol polyprotein from transposon TNT 1-94 n=1 Tax=Senna tora TaxID=362788 RepID=A0A834TTU5_9FABA|nr:Retrovirus-related Pol polyprotein from transposon TNT 1-94 [Senna tora]
MIGECILSDGLYKLCSSSKNECLHVESTSTRRSNTKEQSFLLWHKRLGHISWEMIGRLIKDHVLPSLDYSDMGTCIDCAKEKLTKIGKKSATRSKGLLELGFRFYSPTRGTRIVEALTAKFLELDVAESNYPQPPEMPESSRSVSICLPSLIETLPVTFVRDEIMMSPVQEEDPGTHVTEVPEVHEPAPKIPQVHESTLEIPQVHEPAPEIPLRRSQRERRSAIGIDYQVYLGEVDYDIGHAMDPTTYSEALRSPQYDIDLDFLHETKSFLSAVFEMKDLGEASYVLGIEIRRDRTGYFFIKIKSTAGMGGNISQLRGRGEIFPNCGGGEWVPSLPLGQNLDKFQKPKLGGE